MDAVKFIKERKRLCQMYEVCGSCPANRISGGCIFKKQGKRVAVLLWV